MASNNPHYRKLQAVAEKLLELDPSSPDFKTALKLAKEQAHAALLEEAHDGPGNPRLESARLIAAEKRRKEADAYRSKIMPYVRKLRSSGLDTYEKIAIGLNKLGVKPAKSERWTAAQVYSIENPKRLRS